MTRRLLPFLLNAFLLLASGRLEAQPTALTRLPDGSIQLGKVTVRAARAEIAFPARFVLEEGALEVIIAKPEGRLHETLLVTEAEAVKIQAALYLLKARNGARSAANPRMKQGTLVDIDIEWKDDQGAAHRDPVENWITDRRLGDKPMQRIGWVFTGSGIHQGKFLADAEGNIVINWSQGATVLDSPDPEAEDDTLHSVNAKAPRPVKHPEVTVVFKPRGN